MKCACGKAACTKTFAVDSVGGTLSIEWDPDGPEQRMTAPAHAVHLDVQSAVTLIQQLRGYVLRQMEKPVS